MTRPCATTRCVLKAAFLGATPRRAAAYRLLRHLSDCADCHRHYEQVVRTHRLLCNGGTNSDEPCSFEVGLFASLVLPPRWPRLALPKILTRPWLLVPAVAVLLLTLLPRPEPDEEERLVARGPAESPLAMRFFCRTTEGDGEPVIRALSRDPGSETLSGCPAGGQLLIAYSATSVGHLEIWLGRADGPVTRLTASSLAVTARQELTSTPIVLPLSPAQDNATLWFLFSAEPLAVPALAAVRQASDLQALAAATQATLQTRQLRIEPLDSGASQEERQ